MTFVWKQNSCCVPVRFPRSASCYKILDSQTSFYVKESESEILERSELDSDILPPTPQPWCKAVETDKWAVLPDIIKFPENSQVRLFSILSQLKLPMDK